MAINAITSQTSSMNMTAKTQEQNFEKTHEAKQQKADGTGGPENSIPKDPRRFDTYEKGEENAASDMPTIYQKTDGENGEDKKAEGTKCTVNTDRVDAEIEKLRKEAQEIQRQLQSEENEDKRKELEQRLQTVNSELGMKDNDAYRKQNATYTYE